MSLKEFDSIGRKLKSLINQYQEKGEQQATFDAVGLPRNLLVYNQYRKSFRYQEDASDQVINISID